MRQAIASLIYAMTIIGAVVLSMSVAARCVREYETPPMPAMQDTVRVTVYDTLTVVQPAPAVVAKLPDAVRLLPRWTAPANKKAQSDSAITAAVDTGVNEAACPVAAADSVEVVVPMERKVYTDSTNYRAVISGAWASLDTIEVYPRREIVTVRQPPDRRRFGLSLMAGYGYAGKWTPFVGVGVSYNLFRF